LGGRSVVYLGLFARGGLRPPLPLCSRSTEFADLGAPRRTASAPAYSTTRVRPFRWWFFGLISAAVACSIEVKSTNANLQSSLRKTNMRWSSKATHPLHNPESSNVPIRIFRIEKSLAFSFSSPASSEPASLAGFLPGRCASSSSRMASSVVSKPRFPKNKVGAGGCFWARRIFWAVFEWVLCASAGSLIVMSAPTAAGRPAKSSPRI
jgi:hypothetical protein